jgi:hypothetical protein
MHNIFKGKIKCLNCKKNFNYKPDNGQHIYICSGYKNYGSKFCPRNFVREQDLIDIVERHIRNNSEGRIQISLDEIPSLVERIEVLQEHIKIIYKNKEISEWTNTKITF